MTSAQRLTRIKLAAIEVLAMADIWADATTDEDRNKASVRLRSAVVWLRELRRTKRPVAFDEEVPTEPRTKAKWK